MSTQCEQLDHVYTSPYWRALVDDHRAKCQTCESKWGPFFSQQSAERDDAAREAEQSVDAFMRDSKTGVLFPEQIDGGSGLALILCRQLLLEFRTYSDAHPSDAAWAAAWLVKAFWCCRSFESERIVDKADVAFQQTKKQLGFVEKMRIGGDPANRTFGEESTLGGMRKHHAEQVSMPYNRKIADETILLIERGAYTQALTLLCDSSKHGVQSGLLNLVATWHAEMIYTLGFSALIQSIAAFSESERASPGA